ncbi:MAG: hypothetical protein H0U76_16185 [Ktedonobacteraceae bacterium]|nr:hypothetical protein [Ktedonobacteraceae bacterium]MBA3913054.1 hypothetical protein [Terriglobales bacterium]
MADVREMRVGNWESSLLSELVKQAGVSGAQSQNTAAGVELKIVSLEGFTLSGVVDFVAVQTLRKHHEFTEFNDQAVNRS